MRRVSGVSRSRGRMARAGGIAGSSQTWIASTTAASAPVSPKAARQPASVPTSAPAGTPSTVAAETPASTSDMARACAPEATSCVAALGAKVQKPPMHRPSSRRATQHRREIGREGRQQVRRHQHGGQRHHHGAAVQAAGGDDQRRPGKGRQHARHRDHQAGGAVADLQAGTDVGQQADRQEFGGDHREGADGDRADGQPGGAGVSGAAPERASVQGEQGAFCVAIHRLLLGCRVWRHRGGPGPAARNISFSARPTMKSVGPHAFFGLGAWRRRHCA